MFEARPIRPRPASYSRVRCGGGRKPFPESSWEGGNMIFRVWRGQAATANADGYFRHLTETVLPGLARIRGYRGCFVLRRQAAGQIEFLVITQWESLGAIREFAGEQMETAVVQPEAQSLLSSYDDFVRHFDLVYSSSERQEASR
jgi:heme-degrading monooxygenase HmoA